MNIWRVLSNISYRNPFQAAAQFEPFSSQNLLFGNLISYYILLFYLETLFLHFLWKQFRQWHQELSKIERYLS